MGKAGVPMARAVEGILGDRLKEGFVVVKYGHGGRLEKTQVREAGHPEPDAAGEAAALELIDFLRREASDRDLLLVVVSGGGSALTPAPTPDVGLKAKKDATSVLLRAGASIYEMNAIRKHLSRLKGGRLLEHAQGAQVAALLLSDVVGDDLSTIASGPTAPDPTTFADCLRIAEKYALRAGLPRPVMEHLQAGARASLQNPDLETPKPGNPMFDRVQNVIIGSNILALEAAAQEAKELGFTPLILSSSISGDTAEVAGVHAAIAREVVLSGHPVRRPCCLISGGETTVKVTGSGKGGRNQEFALWCARESRFWNESEVLFASLGSDGTDGPTDAAGAFATPLTAERASQLGMEVDEYLARNDSYAFFQALGDLIVTGPTRTNVMDVRFVLVG
jgi:hydroxypyruvate reductase